MNSGHSPPVVPFAVVVNENPAQLNALSEMLRKANLESRLFTNAEAALQDMVSPPKAQGNDKALPALVVTDLYMHGIDGWHFCRLLRSPEYITLNQIPILVVSAAFTDDEPSRIAADLGAESFLPAPVDSSRFIEQVKDILEGRKVRKPLRTLIVEDSKVSADSLKKTFEDYGYLADTALNSHDALEAFNRTAYDIAVIAYHLPDGPGDILLEVFRKTRPDCVRIMMTFDPKPDLAVDWMKRGATAYLRKPFKPEYLIELCARARRERAFLRAQYLLGIRTRELRESEEKYRLIFEYSPLGLLYFDRNGIIVSCNDNFVQIIGSSRDALVGLDMLRLPDKRVVSAVQQALNGSPGFYEGVYESVTARKKTPVRAIFTPITVQKGYSRGGVGIIEDITERKRAEEEKAKLEEQLRQSQKMQSVGRLAGGVAHDFNNMLGVILGRTELALMQADPDQQLFSHLQEIKKAAERSADLTRQLLAFARRQTIAPRVLDLNETIEGMLKMLKRLIDENIKIIWRPGAALWPVRLDPSQLDQILANLCVNARDAIAGIGTITIETSNISIDQDWCTDHPELFPGDYLLLIFSDNGCGMDKTILNNLFEPFFTTKEIGKGTGLGLATIYGIVRQNDGFIIVDSKPGFGTTFKIYLPRYTGLTEEPQREAVRKDALKGSETILVVEDEQAILEMSSLMLEVLGYRVLAVKSPRESLRLAREHEGDIDLLVTDVIMPEMNGRDLVNSLLPLYPNLKCLFISGYTADVIAGQDVLDSGIHFLPKPFSMNDLAAKVREALGNDVQAKHPDAG